jgi:stage V sporulation protein D (sporulation-specific penicillin-binding protein)
MEHLKARRINALIVFFICLFSFAGYKLFDLSVNQYGFFTQVAANQKNYGADDALRGEIFIKDGISGQLATLATNKPSSASFDLYSRFYPEKNLMSSVVGFLGFQDKNRVGQYGLEEYYEPWLSGQVGSKNFLDIVGLSNGRMQGSSLVLTLDKNIQFFAETKLKELADKWGASGGSVVIQDPKTGLILAMANYPSFDPNHYSEYPLEVFVNSNIQIPFEPGSSFKPITMAAALDTASVKPETSYFDSGEIKVGASTIRNYDFKSNGWQTMTNVLEKSINTGAIFAMRQTGHDNFLEYLEKFQLGKKTDVDLAGEAAGNIKNLYTGREINFVTASFGQGISVTPLQLVNAYSAVANGGKLMRPYLVEKIIKADGESVVMKPEVIAEPITQETAKTLTLMLVSVIENGSIKKAIVPGFHIAGKTGTAQEAKPEGGYAEFFIHNLVGFGPVEDPRFTILVKLDRPKGVETAAVSLADTFGDIARFLINYYGIAPSE